MSIIRNNHQEYFLGWAYGRPVFSSDRRDAMLFEDAEWLDSIMRELLKYGYALSIISV